MIIDLILDRRDNEKYYGNDIYKPRDFYREVMCYGEIGHNITESMDYGSNSDVQNSLCEYINNNEYNPDICDYIKAKQWI